jgi:hypothetical protein
MPLRPLSILQTPIFKLKINQQKQKTLLEENYGGFDPLNGYVGKEQNSFNSTKIKIQTHSSPSNSSLRIPLGLISSFKIAFKNKARA